MGLLYGINSIYMLLLKLGFPEFSIEFGKFSDEEQLAEKGDWSLINNTMNDAAQRLKNGGADFIVIASNTMNSLADEIQENVQIPVSTLSMQPVKK